MITCAVCDDDYVYAERIKEKIQEYALQKDIQCAVDVYGSGEELLTNDAVRAAYLGA